MGWPWRLLGSWASYDIGTHRTFIDTIVSLHDLGLTQINAALSAWDRVRGGSLIRRTFIRFTRRSKGPAEALRNSLARRGQGTCRMWRNSLKGWRNFGAVYETAPSIEENLAQ
ncbi:hypothetical protein CO2235_MP70210 [Cupriavidus oxalaticus]|uniref:Uncharacterized protein n=1 Tax=Cupriavidus oxalaticus TaxID=96344 RepID=A0A375GMP5_9BURK|nr:hypothetical protein CO2235_U880030 [Cupriavidus oxalaticus]SPC23521.1 hypothetical protein CO2235_MP70210 [Cupriavidus oxalaticus]